MSARSSEHSCSSSQPLATESDELNAPAEPARGTVLADRGAEQCSEGKKHMGLRDKYSQAVTTAKQLGMEGSAEERDGKLHFNGTVKS